jgi:hypothetical protein
MMAPAAPKRTLHAPATVQLDAVLPAASPRRRRGPARAASPPTALFSPTPPLTPRERNAYIPIASASQPPSRLVVRRPGGSPRRPGVDGLPPLQEHAAAFGKGGTSSVIRVHHSSSVGRMPLT